MPQAHDEKSDGRIKDGLDTARDKATHAYDAARDRAGKAVDVSRDRVRDTAQQTAEMIETNPLGVLVGGMALGAIVAAVLPRSEREKQALAPLGRKIGAAALAASDAAREAGRSELASLGISRSAAKDQARTLLGGLTKAATSAGNAAVKAGSDAAETAKSGGAGPA